MGVAFFIIIRILFIACMVFIIGYIFGGFSKKPLLTSWSKVAAILVIVLFIAANIMAMRFAFRDGRGCFRDREHQEQIERYGR
ncbi:hypothetical protein [Chitinophaga filiformis]|uniref:Uncharacterized protein n=1 Tax=Chitinophaga filiformis TaxID=104663 RepID=A0A1G7P8F5_CHIFI|nr:hypothetical protein [Chitinophaga filiformis]SDF82582.1 hypothetical protein SAMN04488121_1021104 [Chitinophaga filiformis]